MTPEHWERLKTLFTEALERDAADRPAFVASLKEEDAPVRTALLSLLDAHREDDFLESPAFRIGPIPEEIEAPPERVGPWAIVREIGRGGMGTVFLATRADAEYEKKVAIKFVQTGFGLPELRRRFRSERQILARLDHPNIAKLLDGGTTPAGTPYLVMDYIEGETITSWAESRDLPIPARLALFRSVCAAVHYAHQNLVVHRDLKPGNILVTKEGVPKLLDFGIAKLLDPDALGSPGDGTVEMTRLLTPDYASPEQAQGRPVTVLSDVYSLGVVLYELLAGQKPYRVTGTSAREIERVLCEEEPPKPSTKRPALAGDLDAIVLMAMRKEPERRYGSVDQLSADVGRYLERAPVLARGTALGYRLRRFVRRHRVPVAAATLAALGMTGGLVAYARQARLARAEAARAEVERAKAEQVRAFLGKAFSSADPARGAGRQVTMAEVLDNASSRLAGDLAGQPEVEASLRGTLGDTYLNLGLLHEAEREYRRALELAGPDSAPARARLGQALSDQGRYKEAASELDRAIDLCRAMTKPIVSCIDALDLRMIGLQNLGRGKEAAAAGREALALLETSFPEEKGELASVLNNIGICLGNQGEVREAESLHRRALTAAVAAHGERHPLTADVTANLAGILDIEGRYAEAEPLYRRALALQEAVLGDRHFKFIRTLTSYANLLWLMKRSREAEPIARRAQALAREALGPEHPLAAYGENILGAVLLDAGKPAEAEGHIRIALTARRKSLPPGHWLAASAQSNLGAALLAERRFAEAEHELTDAYATLAKDRGPQHEKSLLTAARLADLYAATGRPAEAKRYRQLSVPTPPAR